MWGWRGWFEWFGGGGERDGRREERKVVAWGLVDGDGSMRGVDWNV